MRLPVPHIFRFRLDLLPFFLLFGDFGRGRRKFQLYFSVKGGKFGFQLLQLVLLLPHLARYLLQLRYLPLQHLVLRLVLVDNGGYPLHRVQEVSGGSHRISHCQMSVVIGVLVVPLYHEAVVGKLQSLFEYPLAHHLYRKTVQFSDLCVKPARSGVFRYLLQTLSDNLLIGGIHTVHLYYIKAVALPVGLRHRKEAVPVLRHGIYESRVVTQLARLRL